MKLYSITVTKQGMSGELYITNVTLSLEKLKTFIEDIATTTSGLFWVEFFPISKHRRTSCTPLTEQQMKKELQEMQEQKESELKNKYPTARY